MDSVKEYYRTYNRVQECTDVENTLRKFREQLENLNSGYFALLTEVLDNLLGTFEEDEQWLDSPAASASPGYTKRILQLSDIRPRLVMDPYGSYRFVYAALAACWLLNILCLV